MTEDLNLPDLKISIKVGNREVERDLNEDLRIDPDDLDSALIRQPAIYAYYASLLQDANLLSEQAEFDCGKAVSALWKIAREELSASSKRVTDKQLDAYVQSQPKILALKQACINASSISRRLWFIVKSLEQKKESVAQLCYNKRKEMEQLGFSVSSAVTRRESAPPMGVHESPGQKQDI